jgi:UDP-N-acetylmuramoyl-L-alanyl-D-glutamate--2,6-diaminopimelate ligase
MASLKEILKDSIEIESSKDISVNSICIDSRQVAAGALFVAIVGTAADGHLFIDTAINAGAVAILCNEFPNERKEGVLYLQVIDTSKALALAAHRFYEKPSERLVLVGVTGTNGKTTVATLLFRLFRSLGYRCGLISTVQNQVDDSVIPATHTTPDAVKLNELLKHMADEGCSHVFMECSSHAIHQHRITGLRFMGALFTNITHDHLDYHKTFDEYIRVKKSFFDNLPSTAFAISNADDKRGTIMLQNTAAQKYYYSLRSLADFKGKVIENNLTGLVMTINDVEVHFRLIGEFNAYNLLLVYGTAICLKEDSSEVLAALSNITGAEGRFDYVVSKEDRVIGIVDYAHTPDALLNVLATIKKIIKNDAQVITVVGCGGDRDKAKRPVMATVACEYSTKAILTSDNPRSEDPRQILLDMQEGMKSEHRRKCLVIEDRREAIKTAVMLAQPGDVLLVAGKGHEKYQEIKGVKHHFDDKEELLKCFEGR